MTFALRPDTDRTALVESVGATVGRDDVRTSSARRRRLQKNVRRLSREWDTTVVLDLEHPTSRIDRRDAPEEGYEVVITGQALPQPVTEYEPRAWDWLVQRAFAVHEAGHLRYSDLADWRQRIDGYTRAEQGVAHTVYNALEDAAIEQQIARRWPNYYEPLRTVRANRFESTTLGIPDPERGGILYPLAHAVHASILDHWMQEVYGLDLGIFRALMDPDDDRHHFPPASEDTTRFRSTVAPQIEPVVEAVLTSPSAVARNEQIAAFVESILELLDEAEIDGRRQQEGRAGDGATGEGMPDDARENLSDEAVDDADALDDSDASEQVDAEDVSGTEPGEGPLGLEDVDSVTTSEEIQHRASEAAADDAQDEAGVADAALDEFEEMRDALAAGGNAASDGLASTTVYIPDDSWAADPAIVRHAEDGAESLARIFRNRLQHERRSAIERGTRRGRLDASRLYRTEIEPAPSALKFRRDQPDEKDYFMAFVLDRSASMKRKIAQAEVAVGSLLFALHEVGVETMLLELYDSAIWLTKPFGADPEAYLDQMFHGQTAGGTPLSDVLQVVRARLNREARYGTQKAMFVVTDDSPANPQEFADAIAATTFPVLGVNLADQPSTATYTRSVAAEPGEDLQATLQQLATEVLL